MCVVSVFNVMLIFFVHRGVRGKEQNATVCSDIASQSKSVYTPLWGWRGGREVQIFDVRFDLEISRSNTVLQICAWIFVLVCAYRSVLPRIDVPRICWLDTPLNWIVFGRLSATVAELAWALQISVVQWRLSNALGCGSVPMNVLAASVFCIAFVAECCSWTCLCTGDQLFCSIEETSWTLLFAIACVAFSYLYSLGCKKAWATPPTALGVGYRGLALFLFLCVIAQALQVALYVTRYLSDEDKGVHYRSFRDGFSALAECHRSTTDIQVWWSDAAWMTGYFSVCVWSSVWLSVAPIPGTFASSREGAA